MSDKDRRDNELPAHDFPWPKELSQGLAPGLIWAVTVFFMFLMNWWYGVFSMAAMFIFFYSQRRTPVGQARRNYVQGRLAYRKNNLQEALDYFLAALEIMPEASAIYPAVGDLYFQLDDVAKAKNAYQQYFQRVSEDDITRTWYIGKLMERNMFSEASQEFRKLSMKSRKNIQIGNLMAVCYLKTNRADEAVRVLEPGVRDTGTSEHELTSRYLLAKAYLQSGKHTKAHEILQRIQQDHPNFEDVPQLLHTIPQKK
ncbi:MAG: tetratricopeptide repeat protein [Clostridiales bacterium]|jgi:tetratricopeptide (TPR) repeat protein|nr:tetratricopeptide repeat protein [Clostridiales bacterium]